MCLCAGADGRATKKKLHRSYGERKKRDQWHELYPIGSRAVLFQRLDLRNPLPKTTPIFSLFSLLHECDDKSRLLSKYCQMSSSIRSDSFLVVLFHPIINDHVGCSA